MRSGGLAVARARAQSGLLIALCGLIAATAFALMGIDGWHRAAENDAVDRALNAAPPSSAALNLTVRTEDEDQVSDRIPDLNVDQVRFVSADDLATQHHDDTFALSARADRDPSSLATLVDGAWPTDSGGSEVHGALQARAAEALQVEVGDHLIISSGDRRREVVVDGTWLPKDPADTAWAGDPAAGSGRGPEGFGPLLVTQADLARLPGQQITTYVVTPRAGDDVAALARNLKEFTATLDAETGAVGVSGGLPQRLAELQTVRTAGQGMLTIAYTLIALTAFAACQQVLTLLLRSRRTEITLLRSRGATSSWLTLAAAGEALVVAVAGTALGVGAGLAVFTPLDRRPGGPAIAIIATACVVVTVALAGLLTWTTTRTMGQDRDTGRGTRGVRAVVVVLVLAVAGLSVAQFWSYGGPLTTSRSGQTQVDPITSIAPAAVLAALALLGAALAAPPARLLDRVTSGRPGLTPALPVRQLARRLSTYGVAIVLVSLATGFGVMTATIAGTQSSLDQRSAQTRAGGDVRLDLDVHHDAEPGTETATLPLTTLGDHAAAVIAVPGRVERDHLSFVAAPAGLADVTGAGDGATITRLLDAAPPGIALTTEQLEVRLSLDGVVNTGHVRTELWLVDDAGQIAVVPIASMQVDEFDGDPTERTVAIPANPNGWRLVAVGAEASGVSGYATIRVEGLPGADLYEVELTGARLKSRTAVGPSPEALPVVITPQLADRIQVDRGDTMDVLLPDSGFHATVTVAGITPGIPGISTARGIAVDLPTLVSYATAHDQDVPAPNAVLIATDEPQAVIDDALTSTIVSTTATTSHSAPSSRIAIAAVDVSWWAAAAVVVFAALAVAAMGTSLARARRGERQMLRALGVAPRRQSRIAASEMTGAIVVGVVIGLATGALAAAMTIPDLTRSATPERPAAVEPRLALLVPGFALLAALLIVALAVVVALYARRVRHEASTPRPRQVGS